MFSIDAGMRNDLNVICHRALMLQVGLPGELARWKVEISFEPKLILKLTTHLLGWSLNICE